MSKPRAHRWNIFDRAGCLVWPGDAARREFAAPFDSQDEARSGRHYSSRARGEAVINTGGLNRVELLGGGGAVARVAPSAAAAFHREARLLVQYNAYWSDPADAEASQERVRKLRSAMAAYKWVAYVNYTDSDLTEPLEQYYGSSLARLREVRRKYDPGNFFAQPHGVPPAGSS